MTTPAPAQIEFWRDTIDYEGRYMVSNLGRIKSLLGKGRLLKPILGNRGYHYVKLSRPEDGRKYINIHRLVAQHFLEDWDPDLTVDHINYNRADNRATNLRMITFSKNRSNQNKEGKTSIYRGVCWHKAGKKWASRIRRDGEQIYLGIFDTELEAAQARDNYIREHGLEEDYELNDLSEA